MNEKNNLNTKVWIVWLRDEKNVLNLKTWVNDDAAKDETWLGISICTTDNRRYDISMDEEISAVEDGVAAMVEEIERGCSRKEITRTMTAAGLES